MSFKKKNIIQHKASNKVLSNNFNNTDRQNKAQLNLNSYFYKNVPNLYTKLSDKYLHFGSEKNLSEKKSSKNILFTQIKKLITEFENEENERKKKEKKKKKKSEKEKEKEKSKKPRPKKTKKLSTMLIPHKKVYYITPKVKTQMQLNRYLINDFKENDSEQEYLKRSKKYQKMNEEFDELIMLKQIKEAAKNGVSEKINEAESFEEDLFDPNEDAGLFDFELNSNNSIQPVQKLNAINGQKKIDVKKRNSIYFNNNYNLSLRRLYTENVKEPEKKIISSNLIHKALGHSQNHKNSKFKNNNNESSANEGNDKKNNSKSPGIKFLMDVKNRRNSILSHRHLSISPVSKVDQRQIMKKICKKQKSIVDKYTLSNRIYRSHMNSYNKYLKNKQIMRGKNFSKQLAFLEKEKEKFGIGENEDANEPGGLPRLNYTKLLYEVQLKNIFTNSFNTMRIFEEGDQDLDLDNLDKIKKLIKDYEIEMTHVLKVSDIPSYIKRNFAKKTVGKYHSSRGVYFG